MKAKPLLKTRWRKFIGVFDDDPLYAKVKKFIEQERKRAPKPRKGKQ